MNKSKAPEWLPDWRDASQYPRPQVAPANQWQWEFLRRNAGYREDYENHEHKGSGFFKLSRELGDKYGLVDERLFDPSDSRFKVFASEVDDRIFGLAHEFKVRTGLKVLFPDLHRARKFMNGESKHQNKEQHARHFNDPERFKTLIIDMRDDVASQLRTIEPFLIRSQKTYLKRHKKEPVPPEDYLRFLRTWDALISGAEPVDVGIELGGKDPERDGRDAITDEVMQHRERAQELIDGGYLDIDWHQEESGQEEPQHSS